MAQRQAVRRRRQIRQQNIRRPAVECPTEQVSSVSGPPSRSGPADGIAGLSQGGGQRRQRLVFSDGRENKNGEHGDTASNQVTRGKKPRHCGEVASKDYVKESVA